MTKIVTCWEIRLNSRQILNYDLGLFHWKKLGKSICLGEK